MTKEELKAYRSILQEIRQIREELARLKAGGPLGVRLTGLPRGSGTSDPVGRAAVEAAALCELLDARLCRLFRLRAEIEGAVAALTSRERLLIRKRYMEGKRWEQIAVEMGYTYQHVLKLHGRALQNMQKG